MKLQRRFCKHSNMGDMKTPDFDDLLAAFDIPDDTSLDAKETTQENHNETKSPVKHSAMCIDDGLSVHQPVDVSEVPVVSVIVKNRSCQDTSDSGDKRQDTYFRHPLENGLQESDVCMEAHQMDQCGSSLNGNGSRGLLETTLAQHSLHGTLSFSNSFSQFSPISSPESEHVQCAGVDIDPKQRPYFPAVSLLMSAEPSISVHQKKRMSCSIFDKCHNLDYDDTPEKLPNSGTKPANVTDKVLERNPKKPGQMQSSTMFHRTSSPVLKSMPIAQHGPTQKKMSSTQAGNSSNTGFLPKAMHLANLNLVPHSIGASVVSSSLPFVHQMNTDAPQVPGTAAGSLNRLLSHANPLPTYVPNLSPPPESNIHLPPRGYRCLECGDSFGVERSLSHHYGRRSVHIEVACTHCAKTMVFFNKCVLLAHAREHRSRGVIMQCTQLVMKPIAEDQMFGQMLGHTLSESSVHMGSQVPPSSTHKGQPVMPLYPDKRSRHRFCCLECDKQLSDCRALEGHYQRLSEDIDGLMCQMCSMLLPNKCSFQAHLRIHTHTSPYCCPECGLCLGLSMDIQKHVKENCLHYARKAGFRCLHCDMVFMSFNVRKSHIEEKHCEVFYKCTICPVAFKSSDGCQMHLTTKHNVSEVSPQLIFKCSCEAMFKKKQLLHQHFRQNAKKLATCVFKCPECNAVFTQKQLLTQHFKGVHGGNFREEKSRKTAEMVAQQQEITVAFHRPKVNTRTRKANLTAPTRRLNVKNTGWTCGDCLHWLPDRETYVSHMKTSHKRSLKRYPCRQCERSFNSSTSLRRHIRNDHDGKKKNFTCWYCTDKMTTFTTTVMLKNHISLMHGIKNPDFSLMSKSSPQNVSNQLGEVLKRPALQSKGEDGDLEGSSVKRLKPSFRCFKHKFIVHKVKEPEEDKETMNVKYEADSKEEEDVVERERATPVK
ncbi:hypothetical protein DPEC_G00167760 [Dallia pectoralis]|uniref:Uncharacterized protein n=1 Tax=Dallia pectoralis TaxID=75939 RepID=A0ACC2GIK1_DALPE|nr:hypothetical protein DPEC_G00167760 [Dallia pectoralis]